MTIVRAPAVAGLFYPSDPDELRAMVDGYLDGVAGAATAEGPKALIAPHAGYVYSGAIAASAYARLVPLRGIVERVILFGPSHRVGFVGLALAHADAFSTPLGNLEVDQVGVEAALQFRQVHLLDEAHEAEHSLEVQLPFIQESLGEVKVVPFSVGDASAEEIGEVIDMLWGGPETIVVVSSDLSHYLPYEKARAVDEMTSKKILALDYNLIATGDACGRAPIRGLLWVARRRRLRCELLDLRNSGDTAGSHSEVVGYGAFALTG